MNILKLKQFSAKLGTKRIHLLSIATLVLALVLIPITQGLAATAINNVTDLSNALTGVTSDTEYYLNASLTYSIQTTVPVTASITLDTTGYTLTLAREIRVEGTLNITGTGTIVRATSFLNSIFNIPGTMTLTDTTIDGGGHNATYSTINVGNTSDGGGTFIMYSGTITNSHLSDAGRNGGAVRIAIRGSFIMNGGEISNNSANNGGGVIIEAGGSFTLVDGSINNNSTWYDATEGGGHGGGVYVKGTFNMQGGDITSNVSGSEGGGVAIMGGDDTAQFNFSAGIITKNQAATENNGGGIWTSAVQNSVLNMTGGTVSYNSAAYGGGIQINSENTTSTISGGEICYNTATPYLNNSMGGYGGGIDVDQFGTVDITDTVIHDNTASYGGGLCTHSDSATTVQATVGSGAEIINNTATVNGGGIALLYGGGTYTVNVNGGTITGNHANVSGGGVAMTSYTTFNLNTGSKLYLNTADTSAADLAAQVGSTVRLIAAASMGVQNASGLDITGWYWDTSSARFASTSDPVEYSNLISAPTDVELHLIAETLVISPTATPATSPTVTPATSQSVDAYYPQTGDTSNYWWLALMASISLLTVIIMMVYYKKYTLQVSSHKQQADNDHIS